MEKYNISMEIFRATPPVYATDVHVAARIAGNSHAGAAVSVAPDEYYDAAVSNITRARLACVRR